MSLPITQEAAPLTTDPAGLVRVRGSRVTLDTVVYAFREGASAEEIACRYPLRSACQRSTPSSPTTCTTKASSTSTWWSGRKRRAAAT